MTHNPQIHAGHFNQLVEWAKQSPSTPGRPRYTFLYGPPGVGKTTLAHRVMTAANLRPVECNASQFRHKAAMSELIEPLINSSNVTDYFREGGHRHLGVILDEIDGMSTGDKGGLNELIRIIKAYTGPNVIICISNEWMESRFKDLTKISLCLHIEAPEISACSAWMDKPIEEVKPMWEQHSGDLRKLLQNSAPVSLLSNTISRPESKERLTIRLFNGLLSPDEESEMDIKDINIMGLNIHESLPQWIKSKYTRLTALQQWAMYQEALNLLVISDRYDYYAFFHQHWSLFPLIFRIKIQMINRLLLRNASASQPMVFTEANLKYTAVLSKQSWLFNQFKYLCELRDALQTSSLCDGGLESALQFASNEARNNEFAKSIKADRYARIIKKLKPPAIPACPRS
jgi:DNA polymerase III delta prime subunit